MASKAFGPKAAAAGAVAPSSTEGSRTCLPSEVLWSRSAARDIVRVIADMAESGQLAAAPAMDLIDRVWARSAPEEVAAPDPPVESGALAPERPTPSTATESA